MKEKKSAAWMENAAEELELATMLALYGRSKKKPGSWHCNAVPSGNAEEYWYLIFLLGSLLRLREAPVPDAHGALPHRAAALCTNGVEATMGAHK
jgi:hypothetical protein